MVDSLKITIYSRKILFEKIESKIHSYYPQIRLKYGGFDEKYDNPEKKSMIDVKNKSLYYYRKFVDEQDLLYGIVEIMMYYKKEQAEE